MNDHEDQRLCQTCVHVGKLPREEPCASCQSPEWFGWERCVMPKERAVLLGKMEGEERNEQA